MKMLKPHMILLLSIIMSLSLPIMMHTQEMPEPSVAQVRITATAIRVPLPTQPPIATDIAIATLIPTITPTEIGPLLIQVPPDTSEINVRAEPDPEAQRLGVIRANERYVVTGRYFSWLRINYDASPNGRGWVFGQLVTILGDEREIPEVDPFNANPAITPDGAVDGIANDAPSDADTTDDRTIILPTSDAVQPVQNQALPTFTPSTDNTNTTSAIPLADMIEPDLFDDDLLTSTLAGITDSEVPPIFPIGLLGISGLLGILIVIIRR